MLKQLGKFEIRRVLGQGGQSTVFLAHDPGAKREVAIKLLRVARGRMRSLLSDQLCIAARLRHPNILEVYETGEDGEGPYIVTEFVEGSTLARRLGDHGPLEPVRAAELMCGVLDALSQAHASGIVHGDLRPSNILLDRDGLARVMDFGAALPEGGSSDDEALRGAAAYLAPEYIACGKSAPSNDVFAAGLTLYEMLLGKPAIDAASRLDALRRIVNEPIVFPADAFDKIDEVMLDLVAKATARDPALRYASALQMQQALQVYLKPAQGAPTTKAATSSGTLEFLLRRMQHRSDFPSMAAAMTAVNRLAQTEQGDAAKLSALILKDFALTNKLLRVANSAHYNSGRSGTVSTVSRAIVVLGFDAVRSIAMSLVLFERLQDKKHADALKEEFLRASLAGMLARELGSQLGGGSAEEYFVCATFHKLGRLLAHYYLREEALAVEKLRASDGESEDLASRRILGISYRDLGIGVAGSWGFPDTIVQSMAPAARTRRPPATQVDRLRLISTISEELCAIIEREPADSRAGKVAALMQSYESMLLIDSRRVGVWVTRALEALNELAGALRLDLRQSALGRQVAASGSVTASPAAAPAAADAAATAGVASAAEAQVLLTAGIQDITQALMEDVSQADVMRIVVETAYRAFGFRRVLLCLADESGRQIAARYGLGAEGKPPFERFRFALGGNDLFNVLLARNADLLVHDADEPKVRGRLPTWYLDEFYARSFLVMPMRRGDRTLGMLYADHEAVGGIRVSESELALLRTLRNQAVLALKMAR